MTEKPFDGDNKGPKDAAHYQRRADEIKAKAAQWRELEVNDKNQDLIAADITEAVEVRKSADTDRTELVKPHLARQREINSEYNPIIEKISDYEKFMKGLLEKHLSDVKRRQDEEARQKREAAERAAKEAEALKADPLIGREVQRDAKAASYEADRAERQRANVKPVTGGKAIGLRTSRKAKIIDAKALVMHYIHKPEIIDAAEKLANEEIRRAGKDGKVSIPGVEVVTSQKV